MSFLPTLWQLQDFLKEQGMFIHHFWVNKAASEADISEVEQALGYSLDDSIKDFYRTCNGVQLLWSHPQNKYAGKMQGFSNSKEFISYGITDDFSFDGAIMIEPIKDVFLQDWYDHIYFDFTIEQQRPVNFAGKQYIEPDFSKRVKPFDMYNSFNEHAFFLDGSGNPPVIMGDDYQACYTDSFLMSFADYLEFILFFYGSLEARRSFFGKFNGQEAPPKTLKDFWELPSIDLSQYNQERNELILPFNAGFWDK